MTTQRIKIAWVTQSLSRYSSIQGALSEGFDIHFVEYPEFKLNFDVTAWWNEILAHKPKALLIDGINVDWFKLTQKLRRPHASNDGPMVVPWFWVFERKHEEVLDSILATNIEDFFATDENPKDLPLRLQLAIRRASERSALLNQAQENASKDAAIETAIAQREEFLSVCAHDLRSPLGLIQSSLSLVLNVHKDGLNDFLTELLRRCKAQAEHATQLVTDLLDVMSLEQGLQPHYEMISLDKLLGDFHKDYQFKSKEKGVQFHLENQVKGWRILGDYHRIWQVLQNLFENALKFTDSGKNIYLQAESFSGRRKSDPEYPMVILTMKDEGRGIAEEKRRGIFNRFTQIRDYDRRQGRGLGLNVAKQISNLHAGNLWVMSEEGKGSDFRVLFPHAISKNPALEAEAGERKKKQILVIDGNETRRKEYYTKLETWGYDLLFAQDGVDGVVKAFFFLPDAVILTDGLTRLNGADIVQILRNDPATSAIGILLGKRPDHKETSIPLTLVDHTLTLPFTKTHISDAMKAIKKRKQAA